MVEAIAALFGGRVARSVRKRLKARSILYRRSRHDTEIEGHRFRLNIEDNYAERRMWLTQKLYERDSIAAMRHHIENKIVLFFDIGANCGVYCISIAKWAGTGSRVLAFEPNPIMARRLEENIALNELNEKIEVHRVAIGGEYSSANLTLQENLGSASIRVCGDRADSVDVDMVPLKLFVDKFSQNHEIFAIKIDVEGHESECLTPFFTDVPKNMWPHLVMLEIAHADEWSSDLLGLMETNGYVRDFNGDGNVLMALSNTTTKMGP